MEINRETIKLKKDKYEVLTKTVEWAINNGYLVKEDLPIRKGVPEKNENNDFLISSSRDDISRWQQVEDVFVFTGLNKRSIKREAKFLLQKIGLDDFKLEVKNWPKES